MSREITVICSRCGREFTTHDPYVLHGTNDEGEETAIYCVGCPYCNMDNPIEDRNDAKEIIRPWGYGI